MGLGQKVAEAKADANVTAPEVKGKVGADNSKMKEKFIASGQSERATVDKEKEGSKSNTVTFLGVVFDNSRNQNRTEKNKTEPSYLVVGYRFQLGEDCMVPEAKIKQDWKDLIDVENITERPAKAGEIVELNLVETGYFISKVEYAGKFTGGANPVVLTAKYSASRTEPKPVLSLDGISGSIKTDENGRQSVLLCTEDKKCKPEYQEKWGALFRTKVVRKGGSSAPKATGEAQKDIAAAFRALYASKKAQ